MRLRTPETTVTGSRIRGLGSAQPERVVSNEQLAASGLETSDDWIRDRVGIVERRFADPDESLIDLAVDAGAKAVADAGLTPGDMDSVLVASCSMPTPIPNATARVVQRVGAGAAQGFDVNAACAGFCYAVASADDAIRAGSARHVLVIGAEKMTEWIDPADRSTAIIFADGAGAAVLGPAGADEGGGIGPVAAGNSGELSEAIRIEDRTAYIIQEGQTVFRWATTRIAPVALQAVEWAGLAPTDIDVLVPHQANLRIVEAMAKRLRSAGARDDLVVADDIVYSGNTSSASIPLAVDRMRAAGRYRSGDVALFVGFGAGLSFAAQVVVLP